MTDERIIAYLLRELSEEEAERFEDECFAQENWPSEIAPVEAELIEAYLRDELTAAQHARFEQNYLITAARQERVAQGAAFLRRMAEQCAAAGPAAAVKSASASAEISWTERWRALWQNQSWLLRGTTALVVIIIVAAAIRLISQPRMPRNLTVATLSASVAETRSGDGQGLESQKVKLAPATDALKLLLILPESARSAQSYRAQLLDSGTRTEMFSAERQDTRIVAVVIPATQLPRGQYVLNLTAVQADGTQQPVHGSYHFTVE